jgi:hypothetical protein
VLVFVSGSSIFLILIVELINLGALERKFIANPAATTLEEQGYCHGMMENPVQYDPLVSFDDNQHILCFLLLCGCRNARYGAKQSYTACTRILLVCHVDEKLFVHENSP